MIGPVSSRDGEQHHRTRDDQQAERGHGNRFAFFFQYRKSSVNEFDVHPIYEQRSLPHLDHGAESHLAQAPAAPYVAGENDYEDDSHAREKEIRASVPII